MPWSLGIFYSCKLLVALCFLIFIRAGLPRYRYDVLTKLGWVKALLVLLFTLLLTFIIFAVFF